MHGFTLCDVDRAILHCCHDEKSGWSLHGPSDTMLPRHFYEALIRCAYLAFVTKYVRSKFVLADCLSELVNSRLLAITFAKGKTTVPVSVWPFLGSLCPWCSMYA
jgi:hypothetical protein